jgi:hypothetical protein
MLFLMQGKWMLLMSDHISKLAFRRGNNSVPISKMVRSIRYRVGPLLSILYKNKYH